MNAPRLIQTARRIALRLHRDERGAEGLEKLLIIAAIVLPLLGLLIVFRQRIGEWVNSQWLEVKGEAQEEIPGI
ncbi:MAG: hypothetical protein V3V20_09735 [Algisphaera sp.]